MKKQFQIHQEIGASVVVGAAVLAIFAISVLTAINQPFIQRLFNDSRIQLTTAADQMSQVVRFAVEGELTGRAGYVNGNTNGYLTQSEADNVKNAIRPYLVDEFGGVGPQWYGMLFNYDKGETAAPPTECRNALPAVPAYRESPFDSSLGPPNYLAAEITACQTEIDDTISRLNSTAVQSTRCQYQFLCMWLRDGGPFNRWSFVVFDLGAPFGGVHQSFDRAEAG